ncbi:hypothetical protein QYF36_013716 [Acer negundo]|nr:hypothetical protein QYF36_013716 [Acer negundo]
MSRQKKRALNRTKKQSKFKQVLSAPIKVLCKFKQVMGMDDCAGKASYGGVVASNQDDQEFMSRKLLSGATISSVHDGQKAIENRDWWDEEELLCWYRKDWKN